MSEASPPESSNIERPYGVVPIVLWVLFATWYLYGILRTILATVDLHLAIEKAANMDPGLSPEFSTALPLWRLTVVVAVIYIAVGFVIIALQYASAYGLWKPKRWARKVGITSLGLGVIVSIARVLESIAFSTALQLNTEEIPSWGIPAIALNTLAFSVAWRFLNRLEVRDYIESEGHPKTVPFRLSIQELPDSIREKSPESVAWIAEAKSVGEIFLDDDHLVIVRPPSGPVGTIPIEDIVKLERGEMRLWSEAYEIARSLDLWPSTFMKVSKLKINYVTKSGLTSTVTLVAERKICPRCGGKMSLATVGWYCTRDHHIMDPTTRDLVQMIESRRSAKTSREGTHPDRSDPAYQRC